jgi:uncharacterized protein
MTGDAEWPPRGMTRLLVLQPTSFCNIDCDYCYLPDRDKKHRMRPETLRSVLKNLVHDEVFAGTLEILWHAGEPLTLGIEYYRQANEIIDECVPSYVRVRQTFQTNGILLDESWCKFLKDGAYAVGLSLDGPQLYHDKHRKTRTGIGTFDKVMTSAALLRQNNIDFYVICVLSALSLRDPLGIMEFAEDHALQRLCFNVEETEGPHVSETLAETDIENLAHSFFSSVIEHCETHPKSVWVRELNDMFLNIRACVGGAISQDVNTPFRIITVDTTGAWSTFCPELMATKSSGYRNFRLGDLTKGPISAHSDDIFERLYKDIRSGIEQCRLECEYFPVCGGGRPANKFAEHGKFDTTETGQCKVTVKALADACADYLHKHIVSAAF